MIPLDPVTGAASIASGLGTSSGPSMASGAAYGSTVGGLTVKKTDWPGLVGAALFGAALVWVLKR